MENDCISIWPIDGIPIVTNSLGQSEPGSNGNEVALKALQNPRTGASPSDAV